MHVNEITAELERTGVPLLLGAASNGVHTVPDGLAALHEQLHEYTEQHLDRFNHVDTPAAERAIAKMLQQIGAMTAFGNGQDIITEHLQPALAVFLDDMQATINRAGKYGRLGYQDGTSLLTEPEDVRLAYIELTELYPKYGALRASWAHLRPKSGDSIDPRDMNSILAEIANAPDVIPNYVLAEAARSPWPWPSNVFHIKFAWLLDHGAQIWLPTIYEQNQAWQKYNPGRRAIAA